MDSNLNKLCNFMGCDWHHIMVLLVTSEYRECLERCVWFIVPILMLSHPIQGVCIRQGRTTTAIIMMMMMIMCTVCYIVLSEKWSLFMALNCLKTHAHKNQARAWDTSTQNSVRKLVLNNHSSSLLLGGEDGVGSGGCLPSCTHLLLDS